MVTELSVKTGKMESETVLCTYGKLAANQHGVVSLQVSINLISFTAELLVKAD